MRRRELKKKISMCKAFSHAAMRAKWRYDVVIKYRQYKILCERIKNRQGAEFLWNVSPTRTAWRLEYKAANRPLVAVWDEEAGLIVTFLPIADLKEFMSKANTI